MTAPASASAPTPWQRRSGARIRTPRRACSRLNSPNTCHWRSNSSARAHRIDRRYCSDIDEVSCELASHPIDLDRLVLIVVGAHLRAESGDRPLAYRLRQAILEWRAGADEARFDVLVCTDVWYVNNEELQLGPVVSVGGPGVNALSANLADKVPSAFVIDDELMVQVDLDFSDLRVVVWGMDHPSTIHAVEAFIERYLDAYLAQVVLTMERNSS